MDVFKKIGDLAVFLDDELHRIEASYRIILESSRRYEGAAEIACDIREEIQNLNRQIDSLIVKAEDQHEDFQRFLDNMTETIEKFDEKINKVENYAAKYGYIKPDDKEKIDLRKSLQEVGKQQPSGYEVCNSFQLFCISVSSRIRIPWSSQNWARSDRVLILQINWVSVWPPKK